MIDRIGVVIKTFLPKGAAEQTELQPLPWRYLTPFFVNQRDANDQAQTLERSSIVYFLRLWVGKSART